MFRESQNRFLVPSRIRPALAALWLLFAQSVMAAHIDDLGTHRDGVECQVCQAYERIAPPCVGIGEPDLVKRVVRATTSPAVVSLPYKVETYRPPTRAPPA